MDGKIETKIVKIDDIRPNPKNAKKHDDNMLDSSFQEYGQISFPVVDEWGEIIIGHGRWAAMKRLGYTHIEVIIKKGLTEKQKEKLMLLDNKITERGGWDYDLLAKFDAEILSSAGWESEELDQLLQMESPEDNFDADATYQKIIEPKVKLGDLFLLGGEVDCPKCGKIVKL